MARILKKEVMLPHTVVNPMSSKVPPELIYMHKRWKIHIYSLLYAIEISYAHSSVTENNNVITISTGTIIAILELISYDIFMEGFTILKMTYT
jgi:hypothetical protein